MTVEDDKGNIELQFIGMFSTRENAIPIVLLHG